MNTLMMDTSTSKMLVALDISGTLLPAEKFNTTKHLETLMPAVDGLLRQKDFNIFNIDYLGVVVGPGSFTGVRIAVSTAKAMMMVNKDIKAVAINSLELIASSYYEKTKDDSKIAVVIPTTIKKVYFATFEKGKRLEDDSIVETISLAEKAQGYKIVSTTMVTDDTTLFSIDESDLAAFTSKAIKNSDFCDKLSPCYIGLSQAEEQLLSKEKKS